MRQLALVIVTYKRQDLLGTLLSSIAGLDPMPRWVVVVDNECAAATEDVVAGAAPAIHEAATAQGLECEVVYQAQAENTGGAGGFCAGVKRAHELGADWFWLMDDDVVVEPDAIAKLSRWMDEADAIQGSRKDFDGGRFYWQYRFWEGLCIYNPVARSAFEPGRPKVANSVCFEGACLSRRVVDTIGLPDPRFFIYLDDACYGVVANAAGLRVIAVEDVVLQRTRTIANKEIGRVRQLNSASDMTRLYITRNRAYIARYLKLHGRHNPVLYAVGTAANLAKELLRIALVDRAHARSGMGRLLDGIREGRTILRDPTWTPMPPGPVLPEGVDLAVAHTRTY